MPPDAKVANTKTGKPPAQKGKPLGIPKWGWIVGIALGLIIGYMVIRKSRSSSGIGTSGTGAGSDSSPLGNSDSGSGGGASIASPTTPDLLSALGVTNTGSADPGTVDGNGDSSTSTNPDTSSTISPGYIPATGVGAVAAGFAPNPGYSTAGDPAPQRASVASGGTNTSPTAPTAPPPQSNVHIPGVQP
jgi:hypothetical protein